MSLSRILAILKARHWLVLAALLMTLTTAVALSLLLPPRYTSSTSVVVDAKPDLVSAFQFQTSASPAFVATQVDIITSDRVAGKVVDAFGLMRNAELREQWMELSKGVGAEPGLRQYIVDLLQKQLDVKPSVQSNVIVISYSAPNPETAAAMANQFAKAYIETALELRVDPARRYSTFFNEQIAQARATLEKAQSKLSEYQREKGIIATDERFDVENARLGELSTQKVQLEALGAESASRKAQSIAASDRIQEVLNNPLIANLKAELSRQEGRLSELTARLGDANPQVIEARANIRQTRDRLEAETRRVTAGVSVSNTITQQRLDQVRRELDLQRDRVLKMKATRDEGMVLVREVDVAQKAYDALAQRMSQSALEAQANQSYANILSAASTPTTPSFPKLTLNIVLALVAGTLLGVGAALLREMSDRRIRGPEDIAEALDLPVIGSLPKPGAKALFNRRGLLTRQEPPTLPAPSGGKA